MRLFSRSIVCLSRKIFNNCQSIHFRENALIRHSSICLYAFDLRNSSTEFQIAPRIIVSVSKCGNLFTRKRYHGANLFTFEECCCCRFIISASRSPNHANSPFLIAPRDLLTNNNYRHRDVTSSYLIARLIVKSRQNVVKSSNVFQTSSLCKFRKIYSQNREKFHTLFDKIFHNSALKISTI